MDKEVTEPSSKYSKLYKPQALLIVAAIYGLCNTIPTFLFNLGFPPMLLVSIRAALGIITLLIVFRGFLFKTTKKDWKYGLLLGTFNFAQLACLIYAIKLAGPVNTALIYSLGIIFIPFVNWIVNKKAPKATNIIAAFICAGGLYLALMRFDMQFVFGWGEAIALIASVGYSIYFIMLSKLSKNTEPVRLNFIQILVACVGALILFFIIDFSSAQFSTEMLNYIWIFIVLGIIGDGFTFLLQTKLQSKVDPNSGSLYLYTFALFGVAFSIIFGFEVFSWQLIAGAVIMFAGIILAPIIIKIKERNKKDPPKPEQNQSDNEQNTPEQEQPIDASISQGEP